MKLSMRQARSCFMLPEEWAYTSSVSGGVVAEVVLHGLDVVPGPQAVHGKGMAQIMEPKVIERHLLYDLFEAQVRRPLL